VKLAGRELGRLARAYEGEGDAGPSGGGGGGGKGGGGGGRVVADGGGARAGRAVAPAVAGGARWFESEAGRSNDGGGGVEKKVISAYVNSLCRVLVIWHSAKFFLIKKYTLPSARSRALGKGVFAECQSSDTRQTKLCRVSVV
jgi:hypothetical protein